MPSPKMITVVSKPKPKVGETHRSSKNFSLKVFPKGCEVVVSVYIHYDTENPFISEKPEFSIREGGTDTLIAKELKNGRTFNVPESRGLYIADPKNVDSNFLVKIQKNI